ncbi:hybrid sensor histidine kinase/response regulator [Chitinophaga qingshengii]|uniref:histidine kinase n=1 Tax=Chitinophaga qingshengii TaxID=1569794 RepID=A0ABR7TFU9_9BACT|nr:ATP-binding protein [Chitinophaga qingshengii]MBC9929209.1 response regulator [Chitinophaga qingshengii]
MRRFWRLLKTLPFLGTDGAPLPLNSKRVIIMLNSLALLTSFLCLLISTALWHAMHEIRISGVGYAMALIYLSVPLFNKAGKTNTALLTIFLLQSFSAMYYGALLGPAINIEALAVFLCGAALLIIKSRGYKWSAISFVLAVTVALKIIWYSNLVEPLQLSNSHSRLVYFFAAGAVLLMNALLLYFYERAVNKSSRELETLVEERTLALDQANRYKTTYLNSLSHDYRTQLNPIYGLARELVLQAEDEGMPGQIQVSTDVIRALYASSRNMLDMTNVVLDTARIEAGIYDVPELAAFSVRQWLYQQLDCYQYVSPVPLQLKLAGIPGRIVSDAALLTRILSNLLTNAIKFSHAGGTITVTARAGEQQFILEVSDEGKGIPAAELEKVFDLYITGSKPGEGTGLGLPISRKIAETLGGTLTATSVVGSGSTFRLCIPMVADPSQQTPSQQPAAFEKFGGAAVLCVDDDPANRLLAELQLKRLGCNAAFAATSGEALEKAREVTPDVILLDYYLPEISGMALLEKIRKEALLRHVPVIFISGNTNTADIAAARAKGDGFLSKPIMLEQLYHALLPFLSSNIVMENEE